MNILIVHFNRLSRYTPVVSLIKNLLKNGHNVTIIAEDIEILPEEIINHNCFKGIGVDSCYTKGILSRTVNAVLRKKRLREKVITEMKNNELIWTTTDITAREIGKILFKYKHVMQLMELMEDVPLFSEQRLFKAHLYKIAEHAYKVVVPDENRAYIQKAWWNLSEKPAVLPNKPYYTGDYELLHENDDTFEKIKNEKRFIILFQGHFSNDRRLDEFAEAVKLLGTDKYAFYVAGNSCQVQEELCCKYPFIEYLGFVPSEKLLQITKYAHIGLLPYVVPNKKEYYPYSRLNVLFCAPNKIYEYALCGLPMIGTDVPGLKYPFEKYNIGVCCRHLNANEIAEAIRYVQVNHKQMSGNCRKFFDAVDLDQIVADIIN